MRLRSRQYDSRLRAGSGSQPSSETFVTGGTLRQNVSFFLADIPIISRGSGCQLELLLQCFLLILGFAMLVKGSEWFVEGAAGIADRFGIPQLIIGLTIVAMGTSSPEAAVSIAAAVKGSAAITIGNVVGSNILNILIILGLTAVISPIAVSLSTVRVEIPFMLGTTVMLLALGRTREGIVRWEGMILWLLFLVYLIYLYLSAKRNQTETISKSAEKDAPMWRLFLLALLGLILVVWGSDVAVDAATAIATQFGMSERFIGLTIVALGTSLPELFTSVTAARHGKADIAIGNIVGSNVFNYLFVVGSTALITPVAFAPHFLVDTLISGAAGLLLLLCVARRHRLTRPAGFLMLAGYAGYFAYLITG